MSEPIKNGKLSDLMSKYSGFVSRHPGKFLLVIIILSVTISAQASNVETVEQQTEDFLPESEPVIEAFNILDAEFSLAGGTTYTILIETEPDHPNSDEIRDVRNPEFLRYTKTLTEEIRSFNKISSVNSPSTLFKDIPSSKNKVERTLEILGKSRWGDTISEDYQSVKITARTSGLTTEEQEGIANSIRNSVEAQSQSSDYQISYSGQIYIDQAFQNQSQQTLSTTSLASLLGVMVVVIILFRSIYYGLNSLLTVIFGVAVGFGIYGLLGLNMTPQTSGAISLGIGIAIDFGIQPIARYREERKEFQIQQSLDNTLKGIITPMTIGLFAANIGFLSLAAGKLTFLQDLGILLALTTTVAYMAAFSVIPASIVFYDRYLTGKEPDMDLSKLYSKVNSE